MESHEQTAMCDVCMCLVKLSFQCIHSRCETKQKKHVWVVGTPIKWSDGEERVHENECAYFKKMKRGRKKYHIYMYIKN